MERKHVYPVFCFNWKQKFNVQRLFLWIKQTNLKKSNTNTTNEGLSSNKGKINSDVQEQQDEAASFHKHPASLYDLFISDLYKAIQKQAREQLS